MLLQRPGPIVFYRAEQGAVQSPAVLPHRQIFLNQPLCHRVYRNKANLVALSLDAKVDDALTALHVADAQIAKFLAADAMVEQGSQYRAIPHTLQRVRGRDLQQLPRLRVAQGRCAAFIIICHWSFHTIDRIAGDSIALAEIIEKRGDRR